MGKQTYEFFKEKRVSGEEIKKAAEKKKAEFLHLRIKTDRQEGDVAGTKLKKFKKFIESEISEYFEVLLSEFDYSDGQKADVYFALKSKKELLIKGPPKNLGEDVKKFKKKHKNVFEREGKIYARKKINFSGKDFVINFLRKYWNKIREMGIWGV